MSAFRAETGPAAGTALGGVVLVRSKRHRDDRGFFYEAWQERAFADLGITARFVQDNHSRSVRGVLRGMHWQDRRAPLGKLVRCTRGAIFDVVVDLRVGSPTFSRWAAWTLSEEDEDPGLLWVPPGFGHGFLCLSDVAEVQYKVTGPWNRESEGCLRWDDPAVGIRWPIADPVLNARDRAAPGLDAYLRAPSFPAGEPVDGGGA